VVYGVLSCRWSGLTGFFETVTPHLESASGGCWRGPWTGVMEASSMSSSTVCRAAHEVRAGMVVRTASGRRAVTPDAPAHSTPHPVRFAPQSDNARPPENSPRARGCLATNRAGDSPCRCLD